MLWPSRTRLTISTRARSSPTSAAVWIPHSYPACTQHAPDEHLLAPPAREALQLMAGLFWDLGEHGPREAGAA